ncbi:hypothetical protein [Polyangium sorediatum]|uniref:Uncharacterized protein n=1 Tax=Polyangium sorediatum TaxID=889274 RepID=A0ABT6NRD1_9BACT|nr:hypothetical protein [Polyangium sorediatum]MDI1430757.1 hypothetical protein [Polyangium sorediatum]
MTTEDERIEYIFQDFAKVSGALLVKSLKRTRSFAEAVDDYCRLEAEFVARMGDSEFGVLETRRRIAEDIIRLTESKHPPFQTCRDAWNARVLLGFTDIDIECRMTWFFAECCRYDENPEEGLAVLLPLIAELERGLEEARATQSDTDFHEYHLEPLRKLRDVLLAQRRGEQIPGKRTRRIDEEDQTP